MNIHCPGNTLANFQTYLPKNRCVMIKSVERNLQPAFFLELIVADKVLQQLQLCRNVGVILFI